MRHTSLIMSKQQSCQDLFYTFWNKQTYIPQSKMDFSKEAEATRGHIGREKILIITSLQRPLHEVSSLNLHKGSAFATQGDDFVVDFYPIILSQTGGAFMGG